MKNTKVNASVYIEYKTIVKCKAMKINMSAVCNEALRKVVTNYGKNESRRI